MPYVDDLVAMKKTVAEISSMEIEGFNFIESEVASKLFPNVELPDSKNLLFFDFKFCHSLPKVNERGRAFSPRVLANSFASLNDQLIDYEHSLKANGIGKNDRIVGHVKATRFSIPKGVEISSLPAEVAALQTPIPAHGLGVLFRRAAGVDDLYARYSKQNKSWKTSMECGHRWQEAMFMYQGEFIPVMDAEVAMRDCVGVDFVSPFKGRKLAVCLGGLDGRVDFWGLGLTMNPADGTADVLSMIAGRGPELASQNIFYMPIHAFSDAGVEIASSSVDKRIEECGSIAVIGETHPGGGDNHKHKVLSNLQVMPSNGHTHYLDQKIISRGSKPKLTGVTSEHTAYNPSSVSSGNNGVTHSHLVDVSLCGKYEDDGGMDADGPATSSLANIELPEEVSMKLEDLLKSLNTAISALTAAKTDEERASRSSEVANLNKQIADLNAKQITQAEKDEYIQDQIKAGKIVTKEVADAAVTTAVAAEKSAHDKALADTEKKNGRVQKCIEKKIDLDLEFEGILGLDGKPATLRSKLDSIPLDANGDSQFQMDLSIWASSPQMLLPVETTETTVAAPAAAAPVAEAASKPGRRVMALAGGGVTTEVASGGQQQQQANGRKIPQHLQGRRALKKIN